MFFLQNKFRKMVEDNKQLASRIDGDLQSAHHDVNILRQELADTNKRITELQATKEGRESSQPHTPPPHETSDTQNCDVKQNGEIMAESSDVERTIINGSIPS